MPYYPPAAGGGSGDLVGPASSTDNALARFDSTTGKLVQDSIVFLSDAGMIQFEGSTASFPALKRFNAVIHARLADDSGYCSFSANAIVASGGLISNIWAQVSGKFYLGAAASAISSPADGTYTFFQANETSAGVIRPGAQTVAALPAAATAGAGAIAFVTDATATTPRSTVAGTGANFVMVMSDATNWLIVA